MGPQGVESSETDSRKSRREITSNPSGFATPVSSLWWWKKTSCRSAKTEDICNFSLYSHLLDIAKDIRGLNSIQNNSIKINININLNIDSPKIFPEQNMCCKKVLSLIQVDLLLSSDDFQCPWGQVPILGDFLCSYHHYLPVPPSLSPNLRISQKRMRKRRFW